MRFKDRHKKSEIPEVNLIPMMDVLLTILTYFIMLSMTAQFNQQSVDIKLPAASAGTSPVSDNAEPLIVGMDDQGQLFLDKQPIDRVALNQEMQIYLSENPTGNIVLQADQKLTYQQIVEVLGQMRNVGEDRVSLAIDQ